MGVDIRLNTEVTPELVKVIAPDFCIAAVGSKALIPPIPGVEKAHPIMDMYDGKVQVGQKVVIVGGGLAGTEAALELAMQGKQVTLVEMGIDVARDANSIHKPALMMELKDHAEQVTICAGPPVPGSMTTALCAETRTARSSRLTPTPSSWPPVWRPSGRRPWPWSRSPASSAWWATASGPARSWRRSARAMTRPWRSETAS